MTNNFIDAHSVIVRPRRHRTGFGETEHQDLITSIRGLSGLMHAIILRVEDEGYVLVAGERRLRAMKEIYELGGNFTYGGERVATNTVPFISLGELSPTEGKEAELEENIRRVDLSWQERAAATSELYELRVEQASLAGQPPPSMRSVSEELETGYQPQTTIVQQMMLAKHLDDPDIVAATSVREAHKILLRKENSKKNERLAEVVGRTFNSSIHNLIHADAKDWMKTSLDNVFDVILTDPPYGMNADAFGDSGVEGTRAHDYEDSEETLLGILSWFPEESFRVAKTQAHLYVFCDIDWFFEWRTHMSLAGWNCFRTPLIWHKPGGFRSPWPLIGPQRKYETILFAEKGGRHANSVTGDVFTFNNDAKLGFAAQKPYLLYKDLLARSVRAGDCVLDPFCGSGPIFPAAHDLKCKAVGVEKQAQVYGIAVGRLGELK